MHIRSIIHLFEPSYANRLNPIIDSLIQQYDQYIKGAGGGGGGINRQQ